MQAFQMTWWMWVVLAAVLAVLELGGPGFFVIFFAVGALGTALALGLAPELSGWAQLGIFSAVSVASMLMLRKRLLGAFGQGQGGAPGQADVVRDVAVALEDMAPGAVGRAELRGSPWKARNAGDSPLAKGQRCRVEAVDGLTLVLKPE